MDTGVPCFFTGTARPFFGTMRAMSNEKAVSPDPDLFDVATRAHGPAGELPLTPEMLLTRPSGDVFALSQNAGMGWDPAKLDRREFLILSTQGGVRAPDGTPVALGLSLIHI